MKAYTFLLLTCFFIFVSIITSCMYVKTVGDGTEESEILINRLGNSGGSGADYFETLIESDNYYIAAGYSESDLSGLTGGTTTAGNLDFIIAKFNKSDLSLVNINNLGGTNYDYFESVVEGDSYYIATGHSNSNLSSLTGGTINVSSSSDFVIAKFNKSDLSLVHLNNLGGSSGDYFYSAIESEPYYIAVGYSNSNLSGLTGGTNTAGSGDFVIARFNKSDLSLDRINNFGGTLLETFSSVIESGSYYTAIGKSQSDLSGLTGGSTNEGNYDFVIAKINKSDLSLSTINNLGGAGVELFSSIKGSDNYYIAVGESNSDLSSLTGGGTTAGTYEFVIAKFNSSDLSLVTLNNFGGTGWDSFSDLIVSNNYYVAAGYSQSNLSGFNGGSTSKGNFDLVIAKMDSNLSLVEIGNLGGTSIDNFNSIVESGSYYVVAGYSESDLSEYTNGNGGQGDSDFIISKFAK